MSRLEDPLRPLQLEELSIAEQQQKWFMEPNGMMFTNYKDETCFCSHRRSQHLDGGYCNDVCLVANPVCICTEFKNQRTSPSSIKQDHWKRKEQEKAKEKTSTFDYRRYKSLDIF